MQNKKDFIVFGSPAIEQAEINEVIDCLKSGWIGTGPRVAQFEDDFKNYKGVRYVAALNSCTSALHLSLKSLDLKPGDEVITTAMTFCATVNVIIHSGAEPVLADVELDTMNIDPIQIEKKITPKTRAILIVHFAGRACNMDAITEIANKHNLKIIEDCAHAIETTYKGRHSGTFGEFGCFSFYVTKNVTTGEGGMVISRREEDINRIKVLGLHGMNKHAWKRFGDEGYHHYYVTECGFKYNMTDIQAAIGIHQLLKIDKYWQRRQEIWDKYNKTFKNLPVFTPAPIEPNTKHAYHLYTLLLDIDKLKITRDQFLDEMTKNNIGVGVHYIALHLHPYYQKTFGYKKGDFPNAEWISERTVSLPLSAKLTNKEIKRIITVVKKILKN